MLRLATQKRVQSNLPTPPRAVLLVSAALIFVSCARPLSEQNLHGVWVGESRGMQLVFRFFGDGTCQFVFQNPTSGTVDRIDGSLEADFTKRPVPLTVRHIPQLSHPIHTIVEFIRADSIRIAHFAPRWRLRPVGFGEETSFTLKRIDENPDAPI